jgi:hypothetical protein
MSGDTRRLVRQTGPGGYIDSRIEPAVDVAGDAAYRRP